MKVKVSFIGKILGYKQRLWPAEDIHLQIHSFNNNGSTHINIYLKPLLFLKKVKLIEIQEEGLPDKNRLRGYVNGLQFRPNNITSILA